MKKILIVLVLLLFLFACNNNIKDSMSPELQVVFNEVNSIMGTSDSDIKGTILSWKVLNGEIRDYFDIAGYSVSKDKINYDNFNKIRENLFDYFSTWKADNYNVGDGPGSSLVGYYSGNIVCLVFAGISNSAKDLFDVTEEDFKNFNYYTEVKCGEVESQKLDKLDGEFLFDGFGIEPFWNYRINSDEIVITTIDEVGVDAKKISFEKILNNYYFIGDDISGEIINEYCLGDGAGFSYDYSTKVNYAGTTYSGCAEKIPYFAEGDDLFEYGKSGTYNEYVEKTGLDEKVENNSELTYEVEGIYKNFIALGIYEFRVGYRHVVIEKTVSGREKVWEGQDIDYDSCKNAQVKDSGIWNWGIFRNCSEGMPRG